MIAFHFLLSYISLFISITLALVALYTGLSGRGLLSIAFGSVACILAFFLLEGVFMIIALSLALISMIPAMNLAKVSENPLSRIHIGGAAISFVVLFLVLILVSIHAVLPIIPSIEKETSYEAMFPTKDPVFSGMVYARSQNLGSLSPACLMVKGKIIDVETFKFMKSLEEEIKGKRDYEYIINVVSIVDILYPDSRIPDSPDKIRTDIDNLPKNVRRLFLTADSKTTVMYITTVAGGTPESSEELKRKIEECIGDVPPQVNVLITGVPFLSQRLDKLISESQTIVTVLSIGLLVLFLSLHAYRYKIEIRPSVAISILLPLLISILLTFDLIWLQQRYINITIPFLLTLIFGVGVDDTIHLFKRFNDLIYEERLDVEKAIKKALAQNGGAAFATSATTIIVISTLLLVPIPLLQDFAPIGIIGMTLTLVDSMVVAPFIFKLSHYYPKILSFAVLIMSLVVLVTVILLDNLFFMGGGIYTYLTMGILMLVSIFEIIYY